MTTWTNPKTMNVGDPGIVSDWNTYVRDNMNALVPQAAGVATSQTTGSTTYADLATVGPAVTVATGTQVLCIISASADDSGGTANVFVGVAVSGATTLAASDANALKVGGPVGSTAQTSYVFLLTGLTAGSNTFTLKYRVAGGTGTFTNRWITIISCY